MTELFLPPEIMARVPPLLDALRGKGWLVATAESCTGGLVAAALTSVSGSSDVVDRGFITYSNAAKTQMLGVDAGLIDRHGAVSEAVARAMAEGALSHSAAHLSVSVTGIAGPGGGSADKPVGLVWFGRALAGGRVTSARHVFPGGRAEVRASAAAIALGLLAEAAAQEI
jgi:nicotinamide-nucleotide amidase